MLTKRSGVGEIMILGGDSVEETEIGESPEVNGIDAIVALYYGYRTHVTHST